MLPKQLPRTHVHAEPERFDLTARGRGWNSISLLRGELMVLTRVRGQCLHCDAGVVWVTLDREYTDFVLGTGQCLPLPRNSKVVVNAIVAASVRVRPIK